MSIVDAANRRVSALKAAYPVQANDLTVIKNPAHVRLALEAARAGTVLVRDANLLPLKGNAALVEFASQLDSGILESGGVTGFATALRQQYPALPAISLGSEHIDPALIERAKEAAQNVDVLVLATRSANINPEQLSLAQTLIGLAKQVVLVCLRNPYDAALLNGAQTIICTCGDSEPSLQAAVEVLTGNLKPTGKLPVPVAA